MVRVSELNKRYYERVWGSHEILGYRLWSTFPIIEKLKINSALEIGCGNKPRIPVRGNSFLDINSKAVEKLNKAGGKAVVFDLSTKFPFKNNIFDLVCAFEVLEHLQDYKKIISEMTRVMNQKGTMLISFPINMKYFVNYDKVVGHFQRFKPSSLDELFGEAGLKIEKFAPIKVTWPKAWQSPILSFLVSSFPVLVSNIQNWLEVRDGSVLRSPLHLQNWSKKSIKDLSDETTALFILKKR